MSYLDEWADIHDQLHAKLQPAIRLAASGDIGTLDRNERRLPKSEQAEMKASRRKALQKAGEHMLLACQAINAAPISDIYYHPSPYGDGPEPRPPRIPKGSDR